MDLGWLRAIIVGAGCLALGYCIGSRFPASVFCRTTTPKFPNLQYGNNKKKPKEALEIEKLADILDDFKMVLVVRNDLKMGKGKIAAQCSHATLGLYKKLLHRAPKALSRWEMCAQPKVVVKLESEEEMLTLQDRAKSLKLPTHITIDAGRTQIAPRFRPPNHLFLTKTACAYLSFTFGLLTLPGFMKTCINGVCPRNLKRVGYFSCNHFCSFLDTASLYNAKAIL